jgi:uncharacterized YccA/Bax inhibitor family protein
MSVRGTMWASAVLGALLLLSAAGGWAMVHTTTNFLGQREVTSFPSWIIFSVLVGFALVMVCSFKPHLARLLAPLYAVAEGLFVGAISHVYEASYNGIVVQAIGATLAVFAVMLVLYVTRTITVTNRLRSTIMAATLGLAVFYGISLLLNLFGVDVSFIHDTSLLSIGFSVLAAGLAAFNLLLDFDVIERGVAAKAPASFEWFAGLGLLVTLVWLYLEMLRLLAKLQRN